MALLISRASGLRKGVPKHPTSGQQTSTAALDATLAGLPRGGWVATDTLQVVN